MSMQPKTGGTRQNRQQADACEWHGTAQHLALTATQVQDWRGNMAGEAHPVERLHPAERVHADSPEGHPAVLLGGAAIEGILQSVIQAQRLSGCLEVGAQARILRRPGRCLARPLYGDHKHLVASGTCL